MASSSAFEGSVDKRPSGRKPTYRKRSMEMGRLRSRQGSPFHIEEIRTVSDLSRFVKAYDVRGTVPDQLNAQVAHAFGAAFVRVLRREAPVPRIVIAHDMRPSSPELADAFAAGANTEGADVVLAGLGSTDLLYFAAGHLDLPGVMLTASHNPARYNGIKLCRAGAKPIGLETGLAEIRDEAQALLDGASPHGAGTGVVERRDLLTDYARHLRTLVDLSGIRPLKVVVDAGNGMAGYTVPAVLRHQKLAAVAPGN